MSTLLTYVGTAVGIASLIVGYWFRFYTYSRNYIGINFLLGSLAIGLDLAIALTLLIWMAIFLFFALPATVVTQVGFYLLKLL